MPDVDIDTALDWRGRTVLDRDGERIGTLKDIYLDEAERPGWGGVHTGLFELRETLVPLTAAEVDGDCLRLPYDHDRLNNAPNVDPDVQLTADEEERLYRHYATGEEHDRATPMRSDDVEDDDGGDQAARSDDAMTRSEEEVHITGTRRRVRGRARLKKYVVTDYVEKKVPVQREEVRVEFEPADEEGSDRS